MLSGNYASMIRLAHVLTVTSGLLCVMTATVQAQTIYRSTSADGEATYSSQPVPDSRESTAIDVESLSPEQRRAGLLLLRQDKALSAEVNAQLQSREIEWNRVDREIVSAQKDLVDAESALQKGRTPLPGERRGSVGGGSRLTGLYFQRLRQLETGVEQARATLDRAYREPNALR